MRSPCPCIMLYRLFLLLSPLVHIGRSAVLDEACGLLGGLCAREEVGALLGDEVHDILVETVAALDGADKLAQLGNTD